MVDDRINPRPGDMSIVTAINAVMADVGYIQKGSKNPEFGYQYLSDADLALAIQPALIKYGLALVPCACESSVVDHGKSAKGTQMWRCDLVQTYRLVHKDGGSLTVQVAGCGTDSQDKAAYKAMTGAWKYAMKQVFCIPTGDDAEKPLAPGERNEASLAALERLRGSMKTLSVTEFKVAVREAWDGLTAEHQAQAAQLRNEAERKAKEKK